jgi:hypothetical protein
MAFPGTYNISYYKGDTFEFTIYPKDAAGNAFDLSSYTSCKFKISNEKGGTVGVSGKLEYNGYASIINNEYILCTIQPSLVSSTNPAGSNSPIGLLAGTTYYYDVEIGKTSSPYNYVYTLLTGQISVTEQVNVDSILSVPPYVEDVTISDETATSLTLNWTAPSSVYQVSSYKLYKTLNPLDLGTPTTISAPATTYIFEELTPDTTYYLGVVAINAAGEGTVDIANQGNGYNVGSTLES